MIVWWFWFGDLDFPWFWILVLVSWMLVVLILGFGELPFQDLGHCAGRLEASQLESCSCFEVAIITFLLGTRQLFHTLGLHDYIYMKTCKLFSCSEVGMISYILAFENLF